MYRARVSGDGLAGSSYWSPSRVPPQDTRYLYHDDDYDYDDYDDDQVVWEEE